MSRIFIYLSLIILSSCQLFKKPETPAAPAPSTVKELFYVSVHSYENISLRSDSSFLYMQNQANNKAKTEGYWKVYNEDTIVLYSKYDPQKLGFSLDSSIRPDAKTVFIVKKSELGELLPHLKKYELIINDTGSADLMKNDSVFRSDPIHSIQLHAVFHGSSNLYNRELRTSTRKIIAYYGRQFVINSPFNTETAGHKPIQDTVTYSMNSLYWNGKIFKRFKR